MKRENRAGVAVVGTGAMGANLARNLAGHGYRTVLWDRTGEKSAFLAGESPIFTAACDLEELPRLMRRPRKFIMMLTAGEATREIAGRLKNLAEPGDVIVNGANSTPDESDMLAASLAGSGIEYLGLGISGGLRGALEGASFMAGGTPGAWTELREILAECAAETPSGGRAMAFFGPGGAGHRVKIIHNGIEYAQLEIIAEIFRLVKCIPGVDNNAAADIFDRWRGEIDPDNFLLKLTSAVLREPAGGGTGSFIDRLDDRAESKGSGPECLVNAISLGFPVPAVAAGVQMRQLSAAAEWRNPVHREMLRRPPVFAPPDPRMLCAALAGALLESFAEGIGLLHREFNAIGLSVDMGELTGVWSAGCIIRSALPGLWPDATPYAPPPLLPGRALKFAARFMDGWRRTVRFSADHGVAAPAISAGWQYLAASADPVMVTRLVAAERDAFGGHGVRLAGGTERFHHRWQGGAM